MPKMLLTEDLKHDMHTHDDSGSDIGWVPPGHTTSIGHIILNVKMVISTNPWSWSGSRLATLLS